MVGVASREFADSDIFIDVGAVRLDLTATGFPAAGRSALLLDVVALCSDAAVGYTVQLYNRTTSLVVGVSVSGVDTVPTWTTVALDPELGVTITDGVVNEITVQLAQSSLDGTELAMVDLTQIRGVY